MFEYIFSGDAVFPVSGGTVPVSASGGASALVFRVSNQREPKFAEVGGSFWKFTCFLHILWII